MSGRESDHEDNGLTESKQPPTHVFFPARPCAPPRLPVCVSHLLCPLSAGGRRIQRDRPLASRPVSCFLSCSQPPALQSNRTGKRRWLHSVCPLRFARPSAYHRFLVSRLRLWAGMSSQQTFPMSSSPSSCPMSPPTFPLSRRVPELSKFENSTGLFRQTTGRGITSLSSHPLLRLLARPPPRLPCSARPLTSSSQQTPFTQQS